jgi:hypothetical protein
MYNTSHSSIANAASKPAARSTATHSTTVSVCV